MQVVFQVNLLTPNALGTPLPYTNNPDATMAGTRSTFLPNNILNNRDLEHGEQFCATV